MSDVGARVAENLKALRGARGLTQAALAASSGVPRATLATIESGAGNPTLSVLVRIAGALRVSLEELVAAPRVDVRHYRSDEIVAQRRGDVVIRKLLPDPVRGLTLERLAVPAGKHMTGSPHDAGTREYLACERGTLELLVAGARFVLEPGDVVVFRGDQRHSYRNPSSDEAVGYSVVVFAPASM